LTLLYNNQSFVESFVVIQMMFVKCVALRRCIIT